MSGFQETKPQELYDAIKDAITSNTTLKRAPDPWSVTRGGSVWVNGAFVLKMNAVAPQTGLSQAPIDGNYGHMSATWRITVTVVRKRMGNLDLEEAEMWAAEDQILKAVYKVLGPNGTSSLVGAVRLTWEGCDSPETFSQDWQRQSIRFLAYAERWQA